MIDFKEEVNKFKPVLTVDDVENAVGDEVRDLMELLQHISKQLKEKEE